MANLLNTVINDSGYLALPAGTSSQRTIISYSTPGTYTWTAPVGVTRIQVLVVGGGGGGGGGGTIYDGNGGGGAGGVVYNSNFTVSPGTAYTVIVGAGGAGGAQTPSSRGTTGSNSSFSTITAYGGGGGGSDTASQAGLSGGSGGGAGVSGSSTPYSGGSGTANQGNAGGNVLVGGAGPGGGGAGGGGAGTVGSNGAQTSPGGNGGSGLLYAITGNSVWYGGGGGGSSWTSTGGIGGVGGGGNGASRTSAYAAQSGVNGTGGGGGAGAATYSSGTGGSGLVVINYTAEVVEIFSKTGTTTWTCPANVTAVEALVIAGGGGGGGAYVGGGGGGGGIVYNTSYTVIPGNSYTVTVGTGGTGGTGGTIGSSGGNSVFDTITAIGGGGGGTYNSSINGITGGSGGGAAYTGTAGSGTSGQGYAGGASGSSPNRGGGGGGAGGVGINYGINTVASTLLTSGSAGGPGLPFSITGTKVYYSGGGGGGSDAFGGAGGIGGGGAGGNGTSTSSGGTITYGSTAGQNAIISSGGGGGGAGGQVGTLTGGNGGSGVVILKYNGVTKSASNTQGQIRFNSTNNQHEIYQGKNGWNSLASSGDIVGSALFFHIDAGNKNSKVFYPTKLLDDKQWTLGSGSVGDFSENGVDAANVRLVDGDPWGNRAIIWEGRAQGTNSGEGGWNSSFFTINPYIPYRLTVWMRRTVIGTGSSYFGTNNVRTPSDRSNNGNPYFMAGGWPAQQNQWYLLVAHCFPDTRAAGQTSIHPDSGWYSVEYGTSKLSTAAWSTDYILRSDATTINHRTYLYYTTTTTGRQQFYRPRIDALDGTEPTLLNLLNDDPVDPYIWYDMQGRNHLQMYNSPSFESNGTSCMVFNGSNQYCQTNLQTQISFPNGGTFEIWTMINAKGIAQGFLSIVNGPSYLNFYMDSSNKMRWEVIGTTSSGYTDIFSTTIFEIGKWYHVVGTFNPTTQTISIYINGVLETSLGSYTNMPGNSTYSSYIALGNYGGYLNGKIALARIYTKPLTLDEINQNFNAQRGRFGI